MNEYDVEMHKQNDPQEHAAGAIDAHAPAADDDLEAGPGPSVSPSEPEMRRDQVPHDR